MMTQAIGGFIRNGKKVSNERALVELLKEFNAFKDFVANRLTGCQCANCGKWGTWDVQIWGTPNAWPAEDGQFYYPLCIDKCLCEWLENGAYKSDSIVKFSAWLWSAWKAVGVEQFAHHQPLIKECIDALRLAECPYADRQGAAEIIRRRVKTRLKDWDDEQVSCAQK